MNDLNRPGVAGGYFKPRRLGHVNLWVNKHREVAEFYRSVVGIQEAYRREAIPAIFMSNGNTYHDVAVMDLAGPRAAGYKVGLHHFALELETEEALVCGYEASLKDGFKFDFTISADVTNSAYGSDPDGNRFEVYADVVEDWRAERSGAVTTGGRKWTPGETPPLTKHLYPVDPEIMVVDDAVFHPLRSSHAVLVASDYDAMLHHYTRIVGLHVIAGGPEQAFVILGGSLEEESLAIFRAHPHRPAGLHHFGMELPSEQSLEQSRAELVRRGMRPVIEIDHPTRRSLYVGDPDGNLIQFYVNRFIDYPGWLQLEDDLALYVA